MAPESSGLPEVSQPRDIENRDTASCLFDGRRHRDVYSPRQRYSLLILELLEIIHQGCSIVPQFPQFHVCNISGWPTSAIGQAGPPVRVHPS